MSGCVSLCGGGGGGGGGGMKLINTPYCSQSGPIEQGVHYGVGGHEIVLPIFLEWAY